MILERRVVIKTEGEKLIIRVCSEKEAAQTPINQVGQAINQSAFGRLAGNEREDTEEEVKDKTSRSCYWDTDFSVLCSRVKKRQTAAENI